VCCVCCVEVSGQLYDAAEWATLPGSARDMPSMLASYEAARLGTAIQHVLISQRLAGTTCCGRAERESQSLENAAMSRAVSRLTSGQTMLKISVPCTVPIICRHRAGTPARISRR